MNESAQKIRDEAIAQAIEYGYETRLGVGFVAPLGRFEAEPFYAMYFESAALEGCGEDIYNGGDDVEATLLEVSDDEREAFELAPETSHVAVTYSSQGFIGLVEMTRAEYDEAIAAQESADDSEQE